LRGRSFGLSGAMSSPYEERFEFDCVQSQQPTKQKKQAARNESRSAGSHRKGRAAYREQQRRGQTDLHTGHRRQRGAEGGAAGGCGSATPTPTRTPWLRGAGEAARWPVRTAAEWAGAGAARGGFATGAAWLMGLRRRRPGGCGERRAEEERIIRRREDERNGATARRRAGAGGVVPRPAARFRVFLGCSVQKSPKSERTERGI
jgi:hypothetical protein